MNLVFAGTPVFAVPSLQALLDAGHRVLAVYTQPDRPAGRGRKLAHSPVKQLAIEHDLRLHQPTSLKTDAEAGLLRDLAPDAMIVVAYGLLLPKAILAIPRFGCINVHASLLPRWRGAAPIQRAIEAGDAVTGVTIMQLEEGLDTGPMLAQAQTAITETDTAATIHERLGKLGAVLLVEALARLERGAVQATPQDHSQASYAAKLHKDEGRIDWRVDAAALARRVRAFNPWPVAHTTLAGRPLRIWTASSEPGGDDVPPGTVLSADAGGIRVRCGQGTLCVTQLQAEGGKPLAAREFLNGRTLPAGTRLGA